MTTFNRRTILGSMAAVGAASQIHHLAAQSATPLATPQATPAMMLTTETVVQITGGKESSSDTAGNWNVWGTDLGSTFLHKDETVIVLGDTFGAGKSLWRSNVLGFISDDDPADGLAIDRMITDQLGDAKEVLPSKKIDFVEMTIIPTYGVSVDDRMFLHYMSVNHWGDPGKWVLNHSGWAYSDDDGENWTSPEESRWAGDSNFGQVAIEHYEGHLYIWGIPGGRYGGVCLARCAPADILNLATYEYWTGSDWAGEEAAAEIIVPANVGELSVRYNSHYNRWIMMYLNDPEGLIELRVANDILGPWSDPYIVTTAVDYPQLYAPFMYPRWNDRAEIYFNLSMFGPYQVYLLKTQLPDNLP